MHEFQTNWTEQELKTYMLLYCAHADFVMSEEEKEYIRARIGKEEYKRIRKEFEQDNDYQRIQKIDATVERYNYTKEQLDAIFQSLKNLFLADGEIDLMEQNILRGLRHLLKVEPD